jgi:hypothetical protein
VMADADEYGDRSQRRKCGVFHERSATSTQRTTLSKTVRRSLAVLIAVCDTGKGREQPSGSASGQHSAQNRGVAHAPAPSVTPLKRVRARQRAPRLPFRLSARK